MTIMKNIRMTGMKKRLIALVLAVIITATVGYTVVQACVAVPSCTSGSYTVETGKTGTDTDTHEYKGGFLNLITYKCTITSTWKELRWTCGNGHNGNTFKQILTTIHDGCR